MIGVEPRPLPPGPWRLRRGFVATRISGAILLVGAALTFLAMFGSGLIRKGAELRREAAVAIAATNGVDATFVRRGPERGPPRRGLLVLRAIRGKAVATVEGRQVQLPVDLQLVVSSEADMPPLRVLYTNGTREMVTSWHVATHTERWWWLALVAAMCTVLDSAVWLVAYRLWRRARVAAAVAYEGVEILAPYEVEAPRWWRRRALPRLVATWELDGVKGTQRLDPAAKRGLPPLAGGRVLLLVSPRMLQHALVRDRDLRPLRIDDADVAVVHARPIGRTNRTTSDRLRAAP